MSQLFAAFGEAELPFPVGTPVSGWIPPVREVTKVTDPVEACIAVLANEEKRIVLISVDTLFIPAGDADEIRRQAAKAAGTSLECVLIAATHNHCAPALDSDYNAPRNETFAEALREQVTDKVRELAGRLQPAQLGSGFAYENDLTWNRRYILPDGTAFAHPQVEKIEVLCAEGPIDPKVGVICVRDLSGKAMGYIVNFACHPLFYGGDRIGTANFPGVLRKKLKEMENPKLVTVFFQGAAGDISHSDPFDPGRTTMESVGTRLAERSFEAAHKAEYRRNIRLEAVSADTYVPKRVITQKQLEMTKKVLKGEAEVIDPSWHPVSSMDPKVFAANLLKLQESIAAQPMLRAPLQALRIGDTCFGTIPGELFVRLGMEIKLRNSGTETYIIGYANGNLGYIATEEAYQRGGYETTPCEGSKVGPEAGKLLVERAAELLSMLS